MSDYPSEERQRSGFAIRFIKALMRSNAASEVGIEAVHLCTLVAATEDRLHYKKAPAFWRSELLHRLGKGSPKALLRIRQSAIDAGLLHHEPGTRTEPSRYWVRVPEWLQPHFDAFRKRNGKDATRSENGTESGTENGTLSITHIPITERGTRKRFTPPTIEEVKGFIREHGCRVDAEKFVLHYEANGWMRGRNPMKDWRAAVRYWARSDADKSPTKSQAATAKPIKPMRRVPK